MSWVGGIPRIDIRLGGMGGLNALLGLGGTQRFYGPAGGGRTTRSRVDEIPNFLTGLAKFAPTIPAAENAEIDEAIKSGEAVPAIPYRGRELFDKAADAVLNPIRLPDFVNTGPPPIIRPTVAVLPRAVPRDTRTTPPIPSAVVFSSPDPSFDTGPGSSSYTDFAQPNPPPGQVCFPMNLSGILGGVSSIADTIGSLASTYYGVRNARAGIPQAAAAPPAVNPAAPIQFAGGYNTLASTPASALARTAGMSIPAGALAMAGTSLIPFGAIGKVLGIAAALNIGTDVVEAVLKMGTPKRRRKRLLTKSDVADISTMAALLGKNSEAFKTWLAVSRR